MGPNFKKDVKLGEKYAWEATAFMVKWCPRLTKVIWVGSKIIDIVQPELIPEVEGAAKIIKIGCKALVLFSKTPPYAVIKAIAAKNGW